MDSHVKKDKYMHHMQPVSELLYNCSSSFVSDADRCCCILFLLFLVYVLVVFVNYILHVLSRLLNSETPNTVMFAI
jgi:hypothetical protein